MAPSQEANSVIGALGGASPAALGSLPAPLHTGAWACPTPPHTSSPTCRRGAGGLPGAPAVEAVPHPQRPGPQLPVPLHVRRGPAAHLHLSVSLRRRLLPSLPLLAPSVYRVAAVLQVQLCMRAPGCAPPPATANSGAVLLQPTRCAAAPAGAGITRAPLRAGCASWWS